MSGYSVCCWRPLAGPVSSTCAASCRRFLLLLVQFCFTIPRFLSCFLCSAACVQWVNCLKQLLLTGIRRVLHYMGSGCGPYHAHSRLQFGQGLESRLSKRTSYRPALQVELRRLAFAAVQLATSFQVLVCTPCRPIAVGSTDSCFNGRPLTVLADHCCSSACIVPAPSL